MDDKTGSSLIKHTSAFVISNSYKQKIQLRLISDWLQSIFYSTHGMKNVFI